MLSWAVRTLTSQGKAGNLLRRVPKARQQGFSLKKALRVKNMPNMIKAMWVSRTGVMRLPWTGKETSPERGQLLSLNLAGFRQAARTASRFTLRR